MVALEFEIFTGRTPANTPTCSSRRFKVLRMQFTGRNVEDNPTTTETRLENTVTTQWAVMAARLHIMTLGRSSRRAPK